MQPTEKSDGSVVVNAVQPTDRSLCTEPNCSDSSIVRELNDLAKEGVTDSFGVVPKARLRCEHCKLVHPASMMTLLEVRRLEGKSDPSEMAAVLSLRCGHCQGEGSCVVGFGPMASAEDQDVMLALGADERTTEG